jgi:hypothetical protein
MDWGEPVSTRTSCVTGALAASEIANASKPGKHISNINCFLLTVNV